MEMDPLPAKSQLALKYKGSIILRNSFQLERDVDIFIASLLKWTSNSMMTKSILLILLHIHIHELTSK